MSLLEKLAEKASAEVREWMESNLQTAMNLYPPYLGVGIRVEHIAEDFRRVEVIMDLSALN